MRNTLWEVSTHAENALTYTREAREVLTMWLDAIPTGEKFEREALRIGLLLDLTKDTITHLEIAVYGK